MKIVNSLRTINIAFSVALSTPSSVKVGVVIVVETCRVNGFGIKLHQL